MSMFICTVVFCFLALFMPALSCQKIDVKELARQKIDVKELTCQKIDVKELTQLVRPVGFGELVRPVGFWAGQTSETGAKLV